MKFALKLAARSGNRLDPRIAITLAWSLLAALAELLGVTKHLNSRDLLPDITPMRVILTSNFEIPPGLFDPTHAHMDRLSRACALINAAEHLLTARLCDRVILSHARLPIPVIHVPGLPDLLTYDGDNDQIQCQAADPLEVVAQHVKILKTLVAISSAGLIPVIEIDRSPVPIPDVSPTLFSHGYGIGHSVVSTCFVSGLYLIAGEIEVRVEGLRDGRVIRAQLGDAARLAAVRFHPPYTAAVQYAEAVPHLPFLPAHNGKVVVERMWDFEQQAELLLA